MDEITYLQTQIASMQRRLSELKLKQRDYVLTATRHHYDFIIEADGGTSCNDPAKGFGQGYGSFQIERLSPSQKWPVKQETFGFGHSCNSAEIYTICAALVGLKNWLNDEDMCVNAVSVLIRSDSRVALKWVCSKKHPPMKGSPKFHSGIEMLRKIVLEFKEIRTEWRSRDESVRLFGH